MAVSGINAGDLLIVVTSTFSSTGVTINTPTDNVGGANTYTARAVPTWTATFRSIISIHDCVVVTPPTQINLNISASTANCGAVLRVVDAASSPSDQFNNSEVSANNPTSPSITCVRSPRLYVVGLTHDDAFTSGVVQPSGYTMQQSDQENVNRQLYAVASKVGPAGTEAPVWTSNGADNTMVIGSWVTGSDGATIFFTKRTSRSTSW